MWPPQGRSWTLAESGFKPKLSDCKACALLPWDFAAQTTEKTPRAFGVCLGMSLAGIGVSLFENLSRVSLAGVSLFFELDQLCMVMKHANQKS